MPINNHSLYVTNESLRMLREVNSDMRVWGQDVPIPTAAPPTDDEMAAYNALHIRYSQGDINIDELEWALSDLQRIENGPERNTTPLQYEVEAIKHFLDTGSFPILRRRCYAKYTTRHKMLLIYGNWANGDEPLCSIAGGELKGGHRAAHMKAIFKEFAAREGLKFTWSRTKKRVEVPDSNHWQAVWFWPWNAAPAINDNHLMLETHLLEPEPTIQPGDTINFPEGVGVHRLANSSAYGIGLSTDMMDDFYDED